MSKRLFDVVLASVGILVLSPIYFLITVIILLDSGPPVVFKQQRVGQYGRLFKVLKFRTMVPNAENIGDKLTADGDPRITRVGLILRKYKLDELPQLFNVLRGEMSLVGPRPEVPEYIEFYKEDEKSRILSIKPGITDKASIEFRDESSMLKCASNPAEAYIERILPIKIRYYLEYVENRSLIGDFKIIIRTLMILRG